MRIIKAREAPSVPIYDHDSSVGRSFRENIIRRIRKHVGGFALVDADIAFESPVAGPTPSQEALQSELATFREAERSLGMPE